mgnify:CR=1 FL=1
MRYSSLSRQSAMACNKSLSANRRPSSWPSLPCARGYVLIEDVPGTGKTTLAKALAASMYCDFTRIQFTPDLVLANVLGINFFDMNKRGFEFRHGPVFAQVLLADGINRATPRKQSALLEAMQER